MPSTTSAIPHQRLQLLLKLRVWFAEVFRPTQTQVTLFWAGVIGFTGACASVAFRQLTTLVHWVLTQQPTPGMVESFAHLLPWERLVIPTIGGFLAGCTLLIGMRWKNRRSSTDYMEAIALGDGVVSARASLVKSLSALFSISSGASIGREGPLVQLSAMIASLIGRLRKTPPLQLRVLVACGAAAGIAAAYNAPIAGALFVAEIVLESLSMETFGPLVFASVVSTLTVRRFLGGNPLYEIPTVRLGSNWEILPHLLLGIVAGMAAPWFLRLLRGSERIFSSIPMPRPFRLALGGLIVGALALHYPEVCGNGYSVVNDILRGKWLWHTLLFILAWKLLATAATFGSGAVGGVFTPTLFVGACLGSLFASGLQAIWPGAHLVPDAFVVVGMGALLAATTHAPIMAIIMLFELTLDYQLILPLMLACVVAHYTCLAFEKDSIYAESLQRKGAGHFERRISGLHVADLMRANPVSVPETADFRAIAEYFIGHRFNYLYVTDPAGAFLGAVSLHDVKDYLHQRELAAVVSAGDIMRVEFPTVTPDEELTVALDRFAEHDGERLPVTQSNADRHLVGSISKTDLILALAERSKPATKTDAAAAPDAAAS